jgi:hypothetical protein
MTSLTQFCLWLRAKGTGDLKTLVAELRTACNACHASYLKTQ